jgi:hypothetical protein
MKYSLSEFKLSFQAKLYNVLNLSHHVTQLLTYHLVSCMYCIKGGLTTVAAERVFFVGWGGGGGGDLIFSRKLGTIVFS